MLRDRSREAAVLRKRLAEIESLIAWVDDLARSFLGGGVVPSLGLKALVASASDMWLCPLSRVEMS